MKFAPGQSGNPDGKPRGSRNKVTLAVEDLLAGQAEKLTQTAIKKALKGDVVALRLCLDRIAPARKGRPVELAINAVNSAADVASAVGTVTAALGAGELTPEEALNVATVLEIRRKALETAELAQRLAAIESQIASLRWRAGACPRPSSP